MPALALPDRPTPVVVMTRAAADATATWRPPQLPRIEPWLLLVVNQLYGHAATTRLAPSGHEWRWQPPDTSAEPAITLVLAAGPLRCAMSLFTETGPAVDETIDLDLFDGDALRLAATLRCAALLVHLDQLTGRRFVCEQAHRGAHLLDAQAQAIGFTVGDPAQPLQPRTSGLLQVMPSPSVWNQLQGRPRPLPAAARAWPVPLELALDAPIALPRPTLHRLEAGAALLLGTARSDGLACTLTLPGGQAAWRARLNDGRLHVVASQRARHRSDPQPTRSTMATSPTAEPPVAPALDSVPVPLEFSLGQVTLSMSELPATLAPGCVIELGRALDAHSVSVRANGRELADGELIEVGGRLAVRISRVATGHDGSV
jgi:type III secretion system YscQ/HrcQ family protein